MKSIRSVEKKYVKLILDVKTSDFYKADLTNRVNCYTCSCGHITKTKYIDAGVTPFMFNCEKCGKSAYSTFFKDIAPDQLPTFEWYRPDLKEAIKMRKRPELLEHIFNGGLAVRKIQVSSQTK